MPVNEIPEHNPPIALSKIIEDFGAVIAVLLALPSFFIGVYGAAGVLTGEKLTGGLLGALWGYLAVAGAYELNRRKFDWQRGRQYADLHLLGGSLAVSTGLILGGAVQETIPVLAVVPALSAILRADEGRDTRSLWLAHSLLLATGLGVGTWFYDDGVIGSVLLERIGALP